MRNYVWVGGLVVSLSVTTPVISAPAFGVLHVFSPAEGSGEIDLGLASDQSGGGLAPVLYASASNGGTAQPAPGGLLFRINTADGGIATTTAFRQGDAVGWEPSALLMGRGVQFGATQMGPAGCGYAGGTCGTIFSSDGVTGRLSLLHVFAGGAAGLSAQALTSDGQGHLFGVSPYGGKLGVPACDQYGTRYVGCGFVFELTSGGPLKYLHLFDGGVQGARPMGLAWRPDGSLIGTASGGLNDPAHEFIYTIGPKGGYRVIYAHTNTQYCAAGLSPHVIADSRGNTYLGAQACALGGQGAVMLHIGLNDKPKVFRYTKTTSAEVAYYTLWSVDGFDSLYGALVVLDTTKPDGGSSTNVFSIDRRGRATALLAQPNLAISSLIPYQMGGAGTQNPTNALYGAATISTGGAIPNVTQILFEIRR